MSVKIPRTCPVCGVTNMVDKTAIYHNPSGRCRKCANGKNQSGKNNPNWKGGRILTKRGYVMIRRPEHPRARNNGGYVFEHILVLEEKIGRLLLSGEITHHLNEIKTDNRPENLELRECGEHTRSHWTGKNHKSETLIKISVANKGNPGLRGEACPTSKLTLEEAREIIRLRGVESGASLALRFGVSHQQVSRIQMGKRWQSCV